MILQILKLLNSESIRLKHNECVVEAAERNGGYRSPFDLSQSHYRRLAETIDAASSSLMTAYAVPKERFEQYLNECPQCGLQRNS